MRTTIPRVLLIATLLAGCGSDSTAPATVEPAAQQTAVAADVPSVGPTRCESGRDAPVLKIPDAAKVARTPWLLVAVGGCQIPSGSGKPNVFFTDGWAGLPSDHCNSQSAPFSADGRDFIVDPNDVGTTMADCGGNAPAGYLGSVKSWGVGDDGRLYLLDADDLTVFAVKPTAGSGLRGRRTGRTKLPPARTCPGCELPTGMRALLRF